MARQRIIIGTELKLNVNVEPLHGAGISTSMSDYDFDIILSSGSINKKSIVFSKKNDTLSSGMRKVDDNNYLVAFDTTELALGKIMVRIKAYIPDGDFKDGKRTEMDDVDTGIELVNSL